MDKLRLLLGLLTLVSAVAAQPLVPNLLPSDGAVAPGSEVSISLVILNPGPAAQSFVAPPTLAAEIASGAQTWPVQLHALPSVTPSSSLVTSGSFATRVYTFTLPPDAAGRAILETQLAGYAPLRSVIDIRVAAADRPSPPVSDRPDEHVHQPTTNLARAEPAASAIQRTFANHLAPHESIYFIYGAHAPAAKFQFSFKYKLLDFTELSRERRVRTLQFAYTQRSLWDIQAVSSPFYDTSYMPELIFESLAPKPEKLDTWFTWLGYQAAFKHESNGRDGTFSRSLNLAYVRPVFAFGKLDGWHLLVIPELYAYLDTLENNPDLKDYRGNGQLRLVFGRNDGPSLMATLWAGQGFEHRSMQLDFTVPIRSKLLNFETYLLIQYFDGYGESLLAYRNKSETARAGFSFVR